MAALAFLDAERAKHPDLAPWYMEMGELYERKLWHQLTQKLEQFLALAVLQSGGDLLVQLYNNFISDFETKINLLKLAHFAVIVSRQYSDVEEGTAFLTSIIDKLRASKERRSEEACIYCKMQIAALRLQAGDQRGCKLLVDEVKAVLEGLESGAGSRSSYGEVDPSVHASVFWVHSQYCKSRQDFAEFYRAALLYLAYVNVDTLTEPFKLDLAVDLSLAALLGENVYNFGELLAHPIVKSLEGSNCEWLLRILEVFERGDLHRYDALCAVHAEQLNAQPALVANERHLREKITVLCLMELIFSRPAEERKIPLSLIAECTKLPIDGVEHLLMKTLSAHLVEGVIDQVDGTVQVSWVQPRVLAVPQVAALRERLDSWLSRVHTTLLAVEAETPDLLTS